MNIPHEGDRYLANGVYITVKEVDPNGRWANIGRGTEAYDSGSLHYPAIQWSDKQQPTPEGHFPDDWELIERAEPAQDGPEPAPARMPDVGALRFWDCWSSAPHPRL